MKILVINCGSSSLKFQLINMDNESVICKGTIERIGAHISGGENNIIYTKTGEDKIIFDKEVKDHVDAFNTVKELMTSGDHKVLDSFSEIDAIGHRVVQGGDRYTKACLSQIRLLLILKN